MQICCKIKNERYNIELLRFMEFTTRVNIEPAKEQITYNNKILIIGSCFANEIGAMLKECGFDISVNPFGTLYNPVSIANSIKVLSSDDSFSEQDVIDINCHTTTYAENQNREGYTNSDERRGRYCSFYHHSSFAKESAAEFLQEANARLAAEQAHFKAADTIIITLGTSWVFRHMGLNKIVSNCHKIRPQEFVREFLNFDQTSRILEDIANFYPDKKFIFTISPIRHFKDGAHGNAISKASLLLAVEKSLESCSNTSYFPAYEIVLDELRDYRFYAEDMVHPSPVAVKYIFERFKESFISPECYQKMIQMSKMARREAHIQR